MTKEQERIKLYHLNKSNRRIRSKMMRTLKLTGEGEYDTASRLLNETRREFDQMRLENAELLDNSSTEGSQDVESNFGFTEVFHDSIMMANRLHSKNCSAIKFHIYN